jgi:DHA1 family multidrug resistance protein-like MFS transporter
MQRPVVTQMTAPTGNRRSLLILSFTLVIVMLGFGMVIPIFPFYVERLGAGGSALGLLVATAALTELLFGPFWGSLSDRVGRKPILMIGVLGYGLSLWLFGLSTQLWMMFASRALSGVLSSATLTTAMAYIGDSTSEKQRGGGMGALGGATGLGVILGPGLGGWLGRSSLSLPFFAGAGLSLVALVFVALFLPETLPPEARRTAQRKIGLVDFSGLWRAVFSPIGGLLLLAFLGTVGTSNFESIFSLYSVQKLGYGPEQVGLILTVVGVVAVIGRGLLTGPATERWGEPRVIQAALPAGAVTFVLLLLAKSYTAVLLTSGLFVFITAFFRPALHSLTSQRAAVGQGAAMGLSNSFVSLGRVIGPLWAGFVFDLDPAYPYLSGIVILLIVFLLSRVWLKADKLTGRSNVRRITRRQIDRALRFAEPVVASCFDARKAQAILTTMRANYEALEAEVPPLKSPFNRMTIRIAVDLLAFYRALPTELRQSEALALARPFVNNWMDGQFDRWIARRVYANRSLHRFYRRWWFSSVNRADEPDGQKFDYLPPAGDLFYGVNVTRCGVVKFLARMGAPELTPFVCQGDSHIQAYLPTGVTFKRTQVIAEGGALCDFRYYGGRG